MSTTNNEFKLIYLEPATEVTGKINSSGLAIATTENDYDTIKDVIDKALITFAKLQAADNEGLDIRYLDVFSSKELDQANRFHDSLITQKKTKYDAFDFVKFVLDSSKFDILVQYINSNGFVGIEYDYFKGDY